MDSGWMDGGRMEGRWIEDGKMDEWMKDE